MTKFDIHNYSTGDRNSWFRYVATLERVWFLLPEEQKLLDSHFLLRCTAQQLMKVITADEDDHFKDKLHVGITNYTVHTLLTTLTEIEEDAEEGDNMELIISLRAINSKNIAVALVQPRYRALQNNKYYSIQELEVK